MHQTFNEEIARQYIEIVWNQGNLAAIDDLVAVDYERFNDVLPGGRIIGRQALKQVIASDRDAFPDLRLTVEDLVADGDTVVVRLLACGTHQGPLGNLGPTGKRFQSQDARFIRVLDGKIRAEHVTTNVFHLLQQLGIVPPLDEVLIGNVSND